MVCYNVGGGGWSGHGKISEGNDFNGLRLVWENIPDISKYMFNDQEVSVHLDVERTERSQV